MLSEKIAGIFIAAVEDSVAQATKRIDRNFVMQKSGNSKNYVLEPFTVPKIRQQNDFKFLTFQLSPNCILNIFDGSYY